MKRIAFATLLFTIAATCVQAQGTDGRDLAQKVLDEGARIFDSKDVRAMGATFTEDAVLVVVSKDQSTGHYKTEEQRGRSQIEDFYRKLYDGLTGSTVSKNTVESARLLAPDLMIVSGSFQPNTSNALSLPFTQVRVKVGEKWLKKNLVVFILGN